MKDNRLYLSNIAECVERIETYTVDGYKAFMQTRMIQDAVIRNLEIIGEATKRLSQDVRQAYPEIRWQQVAGLRDVLIHGYLHVDLDEVWGIVEQNLPDLKIQIAAILQELAEESR